MNGFEFIDHVRRYGGSVEIVGGRVRVRGLVDDVRRASLSPNADLVREALQHPERFPCRVWDSHPVDPKRPCRRCGKGWSAHPRDLRLGFVVPTVQERTP